MFQRFYSAPVSTRTVETRTEIMAIGQINDRSSKNYCTLAVIRIDCTPTQLEHMFEAQNAHAAWKTLERINREK